MYSNDNTIEMFDQMVEMGDYYSSGRPVHVNSEIIMGDICSKIPFKKDDIILDVGCGTGLLTTLFAQKCKYVFALDPGKKVLQRLEENCLKRNISNIAFHRGLAVDLPFDDQFFDKIIMYAVIHYLENETQIEKCVRELIRVCKLDGYILVAEIPEKKAKEEFDSRKKTNNELKILEEFNANRKQYDELFKKIVFVKNNNGSHATFVDGDFLIEIAQREGCSAKICKQDIRQPFSLTRRDLIIHRI